MTAIGRIEKIIKNKIISFNSSKIDERIINEYPDPDAPGFKIYDYLSLYKYNLKDKDKNEYICEERFITGNSSKYTKWVEIYKIIKKPILWGLFLKKERDHIDTLEIEYKIKHER